MNEDAHTNDGPDSSSNAALTPDTVSGVSGKEEWFRGNPGNPGDPENTNLTDTEPSGEPRPGNPGDEVPEVYSFNPPEGLSIDETLIDAFSDVSKTLGLSQDKAQTVIDKMAPAIAERQREQIEAIRQEWVEATRADREFGGRGLNENLGVAKRAFDTYATPAFRTLLDETGLGNHPEVIRMFYRVGKTISEDRFVGGGAGPVHAGRSRAELIYDNTER